MANFSALKTAIQNAIRQNGNEEITGDVLQQILLSVVNTMGDGAINTIEQNLSGETLARQNADTTLQSNINAEALARGNADTQLQNAINAIKANIDNGYVYAGIATPSSTPVSGKVFYVAVQAGTYTNFGGTAVTEGITILKYNGTSWVKEQVLFTDGGVFDISAYHATSGTLAKYADLAAALNGGANIPQSLQKGGMSVKFVQSSDNNYIQARCMADEFTTDTTQWAIADEGVYVENPEFIYVKTDNEYKILYGIKTDGTFYFGAGCPPQVKEYIEQKIEGLPLDDIVTFIGEYLNNTTLEELLSKKVDGEYVDNPEFIETKTDEEDKLIEATRADGTKVLSGNVEVRGSIKIKKCLNIDKTADVYNIDNEEYLYLLLDSEDKILECIKQDGTKYIYHLVNKELDLIKLISEESITISEGLKEKLEGIIPESVSWLGEYKQNPYYDTPDGFFDKQTIFTQNGFVIDTNLIIQTLYFYANQAGKLKFGVGTIDQRSWAIISDEFEVECVEGYNEINIQSKCIVSQRSSRLFVFNDYDGKGTYIGYKKVGSLSSRCLTYSQDKSSALVYSLNENGEELIYNEFSEVKGNIIPLLSYKLTSNSLFYGTSGSLKNTRKWEEYSQNKVGYSIAQKDLIKGDDGNLYKIKVVNGSLNVEPFNISKITIFGNSIFTHGPRASFLYPREEDGVIWNYAGESDGGMIGMGGRGMAASQQEFDFKHLLLKGLQKLNPSVIVQGANIFEIERGRSDGTFVQGSQFGYTNLLTSDVDIIIWRAGENVSIINESFREALRSWILYFQDRCPKALIIMTGRFWKQENCDDITAEIADEFGLPYIRMYYEDDMDIYQALRYDILQYPVTDGNTIKDVYGIAYGGGGHPGNIGMYMIADKLLKCIGVEPLNNIYDIYIDNTIGLDIVSRPKQISGAIGYIYFDKNLSPTVNIVGNKTGSIISTSILTDEDLGITTDKKFVIFTMPEEDITITIL